MSGTNERNRRGGLRRATQQTYRYINWIVYRKIVDECCFVVQITESIIVVYYYECMVTPDMILDLFMKTVADVIYIYRLHSSL
jgi:hypothetical protein